MFGERLRDALQGLAHGQFTQVSRARAEFRDSLDRLAGGIEPAGQAATTQAVAALQRRFVWLRDHVLERRHGGTPCCMVLTTTAQVPRATVAWSSMRIRAKSSDPSAACRRTNRTPVAPSWVQA